MPKKVTICGKTYKIIYNMQQGACGGLEAQEIMIGCNRTKDVSFEYLIHEISELAHVYLGNRFSQGHEMRFVMDHAQFQNHAAAFTAALIDCGLLK
jgi:hypothetical protein